jgi:hypothetical protein
MQSMKNTSVHGYPTSNLLNTPKCGARTRSGAPCKGPAVRGKKRCRMHGGTNPGRPRDPFVQEIKYYRMVRRHLKKKCRKCSLFNNLCFKIHKGKYRPESFEYRIQKYCQAFTHYSKNN